MADFNGVITVDVKRVYPRLAWITRSRKAKIAMGTLLSVILSRLLPKLGFDPSDTNVISSAMLVLASVWIGSIAVEDAGDKNAPPPPPPLNETEIAGGVDAACVAVSRPSGGPDGAAAGGAAAP